MSFLQRQAMNAPPLGPGPSRNNRRRQGPGKRDYTPLKWDNYFTSFLTVPARGNLFRVYLHGDSGPAIVLLHGGGYSALTWSLFTVQLTRLVRCRVVAIDLRGHGDTVTTDDENLALDVLASDIGFIIENMYGSSPPPVVLVGHSLGGAVAVEVTARRLVPSQVGVVVVDVVEGTAMDALKSMQGYLRSRPAGFKSIEHAIEYCIRSGQVRNPESARVSVPGQIKNIITGQTATNDIGITEPDILPGDVPVDNEAVIPEEPGEDEVVEELGSDASVRSLGSCSDSSSSRLLPTLQTSNKYTWRINLGKTQPYWYDWFTGLSQKFLNECMVPKLLLLASIDRLDREITVGHMQGRFQMEVLGKCGHAMQEDAPDRVADYVAAFLVRNRFAEQIGNIRSTSPGGEPKEVGEGNPWLRF